MTLPDLHLCAVKAADSRQMRRMDKALGKRMNEMEFGARVFTESLSDPQLHRDITTVGKSVLGKTGFLQKVADRIGHLALDIADTINILLPRLPNVANFVRGVSFFALEGAFQQYGEFWHSTTLAHMGPLAYWQYNSALVWILRCRGIRYAESAMPEKPEGEND